MIVGTAGHIDHGKTTLVRALTGVDTDRLPEEKRRGISIELGYAFLDAPDVGRIGFVDVPGHERLVHTMVAGATGIDAALLLVAADDGPMPQTREHLAVLSLLGVAHGVVAVTKTDRVDAARVDAVGAEVRAMLAQTPLHAAPIVPVSAISGAGLDALRARLIEAAGAPARDGRAGLSFRVAIDRAFTLDGVGTVVTGTVHAGRVAPGDELALGPGGRRVRVRSVHAQNRAAAHAQAGERCALALAGIGRDEVHRGQWLTDPAIALHTDRIDVRLELWRGEAAALRSGTPVQVHLGAAVVPGTVAVLDADALAPGAVALAQLVLREPIGAWHGDRIVLRDASATRTIAGGTVLDPFAPARYRRTPQRLAELEALQRPDPGGRVAALVESAPHGVDLRRLAAAQGRGALARPEGLACADGRVLGSAHARAAGERLLAALAAYHERQPDELGPDAGRLRRLALPRLPESLFRALLDDAIAAGHVQRHGAFVHRPEHVVRLSASEERIAQKAAPRLADAGFEGAWARDLARDAGEGEPMVRTTLARLARRGELHQVVKDLYYPAAAMARLVAIARELGADGGEVTAARFRDATGLGRKRAIQILEYLDRIGVLRRVGDVHRIRTDSTLFTEAAT